MRARQLVCAGLAAALGALLVVACSDSDSGTAGGVGGAAGAGGDGEDAAGGSDAATGGADTGPGEAGSSSGGAPAASGGAGACPEGPAGDPPQDYLAEFASGTRLEARYYASQGLPELFAGFFDTELDDWCDFMVASDDKLRCLPRGVKALTRDGHASATCDDSIAILPQACGTATSVYLRERLECLDKAAIHEVAAYTGPRYRDLPAGCTQDGTASVNSYTLGAEVPPASFVEGALVDLPGVCKGSLRVVEATDGARGPFEAFDVATGASCDHGSGCTPGRRAFEEPGLFSDDACMDAATESYATWNDAETCAPPEFVRPLMNSDVWYRAGSLSDAELYSGIGGGCGPAREREWIGSVYEIGEPFALSDLAPLEAQQLGTGRLRAISNAEAGTPLIALIGSYGDMVDAQLDQTCYLRQLEDGSLRCIATSILGGTLVDEYNDSQCTVPLRRCVDDGEPCAGKIRWDDPVSDERCTSTPPVTGIWEMTAPATGYFRESPGFPCSPGGDVPPDAWQVVAVDPNDLPEATLEVAP